MFLTFLHEYSCKASDEEESPCSEWNTPQRLAYRTAQAGIALTIFSRVSYRPCRQVAVALLMSPTHMMLTSQPVIRRRIVWRPKRTLAATLLFFIGFAPNAIANGRHSHAALRAKPGAPSNSAKNEKLDRELLSRIKRSPSRTTSVIVT